MADYSSDDMKRLQEEAKTRVKEMQKRSKNIADSFYGNSGNRDNYMPLHESAKAISMPVEIPEKMKLTSKQVSENKAQKNKDFSSVLFNSFGNISDEDAEKMLILALCILLSNEHADKSLLLALMYLIT